jgi:hypothetical protein
VHGARSKYGPLDRVNTCQQIVEFRVLAIWEIRGEKCSVHPKLRRVELISTVF